LTSWQWSAIISGRVENAHRLPNMKTYESRKLRSGFYESKRQRRLAGPAVTVAASILLGGAFWYSLTTTLDDMTRSDCAAGIQKACKSLK
tara:strand:- start:401 stop:670 length:270 start_codon:yes stop_codon:yes gene_type:complete